MSLPRREPKPVFWSLTLKPSLPQEGGGEYVLVRPSLGLLFPGVDTLKNLVDEAALAEGQGELPVVLDCAPVLAMDYTGVKAFEVLVRDFEKRGQQLLFLGVEPEVRDMLQRARLYNSIRFCEDEDDLPTMLFGRRSSSQQVDDAACEWGGDGGRDQERTQLQQLQPAAPPNNAAAATMPPGGNHSDHKSPA